MTDETTWRDAVKAAVRSCLEDDSWTPGSDQWKDELVYEIADAVFDALEISESEQDMPCSQTAFLFSKKI